MLQNTLYYVKSEQATYFPQIPRQVSFFFSTLSPLCTPLSPGKASNVQKVYYFNLRKILQFYKNRSNHYDSTCKPYYDPTLLHA